MYISRISNDGRKQLSKHHLLECAEYAGSIGKKFGVSEICRTVALFHDIGKFSSAFVEYLIHQKSSNDISRKGTVIHSTQGAKVFFDAYSESKDLVVALTREIIAICIANHHGSLMDCISPDGDTPFRNRLMRENDNLHYAEVLKNAKTEQILVEGVSHILEKCAFELREFVETCKRNKLNTLFMLHLLTKAVFSCLVDSDRYNAYCFEMNKPMEIATNLPAWTEYAQRLEQKISTFKSDSDINIIRREISEKCLRAAIRPKGIYRLDVPTGGGKTLSSLRFALNHANNHKLDRIIYVIPYLSVLEQTADEIKKALQVEHDEDFILEHHSNFEVSENEEEAQAYHLLAERWESPIILTTMVQFLESIYSCKNSNLRKFHNMANAVIIFDEVQSLPLKCVHLFNEAINFLHFCGGSSVLLCTATQPTLDEADKPIYLSDGPALIPDMSEKFSKLKRTHIVNKTLPGGYSYDDLKEFILEKYSEEGNCLVILNTKRDAVKLYLLLQQYIEQNPHKQIKLFHLSTSMCPAHRLKTIKEIIGSNP